MQPTLQQQPQAVNTPFLPSIGPRSLPINFDWSVAKSFALDFSYQVQQSLMDKLQTAFVDNSQNAASVTLSWAGTQQNIIVGGNSQGFVPILVGATPKGTLSSSGAGTTLLSLLNFPIAPAVWGVNGTPFTFNPSTGALIVSDAAVDSVTTSAGIQVIARVVGSGDVVYNRYKSQNAISGLTQSSVASLLVGNPGFFVNFVDVQLSGDASMGPSVVNATTWDPANTSNQVVLSNGNLTIVNVSAGATGATRSASSFATGKYYAESTWTVGANPSFDGFGICNSTFNVTSGTPSSNANVVTVLQTGAIQVAGVSQGNLGGTIASTNVIGMAVDFTAKLIWFRIGAGNWNNNVSANPATGTLGLSFSSINGPYFGLGAIGQSGGNTLTANFGATAFANAAPSGFNDMGTTTGGSSGVTVSLMDGTRTISEGYVYIGASQTVSTGSFTPGTSVIKLDQLNYDSKVANSTLSLSISAGGSPASLVTGNFVYNIGAGTTGTVN